MPNGHDISKEYGDHRYESHDGTSSCLNGCGCWMGPSRSGGPLGLDPFGHCPNNPKDGEFLGEPRDYHLVVEQRIKNLERRAYTAETRLAQVSPSKKALAEELATVRRSFSKNEKIIEDIRALVEIKPECC